MKQKHLAFSLAICAAASLAFYVWQNLFAHHGGHIALPKALWLGIAIQYWLLLPPLVFTCRTNSPRLRRAYWLFWLPMLARALVEIWLLYGTGSWRYAYGIAHDLASALLLTVLAWQCRREEPRELVHTLWIMAAMFIAEAGFARYISAFNHGLAHAKLWFIGWESPHTANQLVTCICVAACGVWLAHLLRTRHTSRR